MCGGGLLLRDTELIGIVLLFIAVPPHVQVGCLSAGQRLQIVGQHLLQALFASLSVHAHIASRHKLFANVHLVAIGQGHIVNGANLSKSIKKSIIEKILKIIAVTVLFAKGFAAKK